jgi:hypothetical protein
MRTLFVSIASVLMMLVAGCTAVDPDECWVNTSGGFGGGGTIPIGSGVGATSSGDFVTPPPGGPLDYGGDPNPCMAGKIKEFGPSSFTFVTIVADDGTSEPGGWQEAKAGLIFGSGTEGIAACVVRIGMPLRTKVFGRISPGTAATYSANVANETADYMYENGGRDLPPGVFCESFKTGMRDRFDKQYKGLGARMMNP